MKGQKVNAKTKILEVVAKLAYSEASKSANTSCPLFAYQAKLPTRVQKLRKF
ncbi:hypothetical protein CAFE_08170 [Caprobacter fermentans]|uniref:Cyclic lactone autoinducer peptide n=1 Tax=Caproicibacter fermentans TaxID=2576756 RepID=A0A6N8HXA4_9FIRM|nr:hypothetical protein [Caproicibacter fermentans]